MGTCRIPGFDFGVYKNRPTLPGRYVGSRPIKLTKSQWKDRNVDVVKEKQQLKKKMGYK